MNEEFIMITAKNLDEAISKAFEELGANSHNLMFEIISKKRNEIVINAAKKEDEEGNLNVSLAEKSPPQPVHTPPPVKCPKCGSTQIQMVPRKWSLLSGFMTNKIDRVCVNCKCKF